MATPTMSGVRIFQLENLKLDTAENKIDKDKRNPVRCLTTNKIDTPTEHMIWSYALPKQIVGRVELSL